MRRRAGPVELAGRRRTARRAFPSVTTSFGSTWPTRPVQLGLRLARVDGRRRSRRGRRPRARGTRSAGRCGRWRARGRPSRPRAASAPRRPRAIRSRASRVRVALVLEEEPLPVGDGSGGLLKELGDGPVVLAAMRVTLAGGALPRPARPSTLSTSRLKRSAEELGASSAWCSSNCRSPAPAPSSRSALRSSAPAHAELLRELPQRQRARCRVAGRRACGRGGRPPSERLAHVGHVDARARRRASARSRRASAGRVVLQLLERRPSPCRRPRRARRRAWRRSGPRASRGARRTRSSPCRSRCRAPWRASPRTRRGGRASCWSWKSRSACSSSSASTPSLSARSLKPGRRAALEPNGGAPPRSARCRPARSRCPRRPCRRPPACRARSRRRRSPARLRRR